MRQHFVGGGEPEKLLVVPLYEGLEPPAVTSEVVSQQSFIRWRIHHSIVSLRTVADRVRPGAEDPCPPRGFRSDLNDH